MIILLLILLPVLPARAQGLIRDATTEHALDMLAKPLLQAAGLSPSLVKVLVVDDLALNAFTDGRNIYVNAGLILRLDTAPMLQAVMAHEMGHIADGHATRRELEYGQARLATGLGMGAALLAGVAAGHPEAGIGAAIGTTATAQRLMAGHSRAEEAAADRQGMRYMARAGIDPKAMVKVLKIFEDQEAVSPERQDPYLLTHPLSADRIRAVESYADMLGPVTSDPAEAQYWFSRARAMLMGYKRTPDYTRGRYPASDTSDAGHLARAMADWKEGKTAAALAELDPVIAARPDDGYVQELKGWIAIEGGKVSTSVAAYQVAARLLPEAPLVLAGYGRALLAQNTKASDATALEVLRKARLADKDDGGLLRDLAMAYARNGQDGMASVYTAERYAEAGDLETARIHAARAAGMLPMGSPGWNQAQDIIAEADRARPARR